MLKLTAALCGAALIACTQSAGAHEITAASDPSVPAAFDITQASATSDGRIATFIMEVTG